ncbi:translation elongation factor 4 [Candidatus Babeliales bacterium]|nr:translation elongation factor 4 [Candidatus Babeliales bacterium]
MSHKIDLKKIPVKQIRNFSIIAHIDHGKSTFADRILEQTGTISKRIVAEQFLDKLQVEKERGITVKAQTASIFYDHNGVTYLLNLIDTPGHVDFSYEVSRSLYACQGAVLLVDAAQGVQAQTMANFFLAFEQDLTIISVLNKVDLPNADPERAKEEIQQCFDIEPNKVLSCSAKTGIGVDDVLKAIVEDVPSPGGNEEKPLKALLFDSWFDEYRGVVCMIEIIDGSLKSGEKITSAHSKQSYEVLELGLMHPGPVPTGCLYTGQVGYLITGMKDVRDARIGDTLYHTSKPVKSLPGFKPAKAMVFAGIYAVDASDYDILRDAVEKLTLNDPSVHVEKENSGALGFGFRCGFLGMLHMEVFTQRLQQEYNVSIISTAPTVCYKVILRDGNELMVDNPSNFPDAGQIDRVLEPTVKATIISPNKYLGNIITLCQERRGIQTNLSYLSEDRALLMYSLPLSEIVTDFYDKLKSVTAGYASFDYEESEYQAASMVKMNILLNGKQVDALSMIVHKNKSHTEGRELVSKLKKFIHRQLFEVAIQAALGGKIIARETVSAMRKNVTAKCYGGDMTRKRKLLEKQKEGKKRMKRIGNVELSQEAFLAVLKK